MAEPAWYRRACLVLLAAVLVVSAWNGLRFPPGNGYDAKDHIAYAVDLVEHGRIPSAQGASEYYSPPGFYAVAGSLVWLGEHAGLGEPKRLVLAFDVLVRLATALLLLATARTLWPRRWTLHVAALGYFAFLPVDVRLSAMFHPEPLDLLLVTAALYLAARLLARNRFAPRDAVVLGVVIAAGLLVRQFAAYGAGAVGLALLATRRRDAVRAVGIAAAVALVLVAPWYVRQAVRYSNPVFAEHSTVQKPLYERRPAAFYVDPGLPDVVTAPWRPHFLNRAVPTTYSDLWGDYFSGWAWKLSDGPPRAQLRLQSVLGLLPTLLAVGGLVLLVRRRCWLVALVPLLGLLGYGIFTVAYPTVDGDVLKASYMLTTTTAWALCFGAAVEALARRRRLGIALAVVLGASALAELPFLLY